MVKKTKSLNNKKFVLGALAVIVILFALFQFISLTERFDVIESEHFTETHLIPSGEYLSYNTEFCASKLSDLAHEFHFLEKDMAQQEKIKEQLKMLLEMEDEVIEIEQRELSIIREEFDTYKVLCDRFDQRPTAESCNRFIQEAGSELDLAQQNTQAAVDDRFLEKLEQNTQDIRKANRIYEGLQEYCESVI